MAKSLKNRKNNRVSVKRGHKKSKARHFSRGKQQRSRSMYGGKRYKKGGLCMCGGKKMKGGMCGCGKKMKGGMVSSPKMQSIGYSWDGGNVGSWPGVSASHGVNTDGLTMSNHFAVSENGVVVGGINPPADPRSEQFMLGGGKKKSRKNKKTQKGGFFQEIVNLGRGIGYNLQGSYFDLKGNPQPISQNPFPTQNQPINNDVKIIGGNPPDVRKIFINANNQVAKI
jgi:hypothetical protein